MRAEGQQFCLSFCVDLSRRMSAHLRYHHFRATAIYIYITMFMSVCRVRPREVDEDVLSDEDFEDEELELTEADLAEALKTRIGGHASKRNKKE